MAHPLVSGAGVCGVISAENPRFRSKGDHTALIRDLRAMGLQHEVSQGQYGGLPERSVVVHGASPDVMMRLGQAYGQEAVIHHGGGHRWLMYTNGPRLGVAHPGVGVQVHETAPADGYTTIPGVGHVQMSYDADRLQTTGLTPPHEQDRVHQPETLGKALTGARWAGSYPHHDGHTQHHSQHLGPGVLVSGGVALAKADGGAGAVTIQPNHFPKLAASYGSLAAGRSADLKFYPLHGALPRVQNLVAHHGYQVYGAGAVHGRPDHAKRNYNTKHLVVWDQPGDQADQDYAHAYQQSRELGHALTKDRVDQIYGDGKRQGQMGRHLTLREALRSVHWTHMAADKQRELLASAGLHVSPDNFNRERNTQVLDAVHRVITGKHSEPTGEGFWPHGHEIPLEHSLQLVRDHARKLGLTDDHSLLRKAEDPAIFGGDQEKHLRSLKDIDKSVTRRTAALVALRKAELEYPSGPGERCMICQSASNPCGCWQDLRKADAPEVDRPCDVCDKNPCKCPGKLPGKTVDETPSKSGAGGGAKGKLAKDDVPMAKPPTGTKPAAPPKPKLPRAPGMMKATAIEYGGGSPDAPAPSAPPAAPAPAAPAPAAPAPATPAPVGKSETFGPGRMAQLDRIVEMLAKGEVGMDLRKAHLGGKDETSRAMTQHAMAAAPRPAIPTGKPAAAPAPKATPEDHARRQADLAAFTPAGAFQASGKGSSLGGAPKPAAPGAGKIQAAPAQAPGKPMGTQAIAQPKLLDRFTAALKGSKTQKSEPAFPAHLRGPVTAAPKPAAAPKKISIAVKANPAGMKEAMGKGAEFDQVPMGGGQTPTGAEGGLSMSEKSRVKK